MSVSNDMSIDNVLLQKSLNCLQSEDKRKRKVALEELRTFIYAQTSKQPLLLSEHGDVLRAILRCFIDPSEACRESAVNLLRDLITANLAPDLNLALVVPILTQRLGAAELVEASEEVRHSLIALLHVIIKSRTGDITPYFNDIVQILVRSIVDPFPKIKKESCECAASLAVAIPQHFHMQSESLVKPLTQILTHQQYRVRVSSICALGAVVRHGNNKSIKDVCGPFAERLFDQTPQVREAVTQTVGFWLMNLPDRYSYFHLMIPLMLTSLNDQSPEIQEKAWILWNQAGELWKNENEEDIKDNIDFLDILPTHYPPNMRRPNIGCRILVKRNLHKIAPALVRELEDWLVDVRIKASQLLCVLILNAEADIHQYAEQLLLGMYRACNDEDARVVSNIERAAYLMGYFIPPNNYWSLMYPVMETSCHQGHLCVLGSIMSGTDPSHLQSLLVTVASFLQESSVCRSREMKFQLQLLKCCSSMITVCGKESCIVLEQLFNILVTILALAASDGVHELAQGLLEELKTMEDLPEVHNLYQRYMRSLLQGVCSAPLLWTVQCPERLIFQTLMLHSGPALANCLDIVVPTLSASLKPENQDAEMKLKLMTNVAIIFQNAEKTHDIPLNVMAPFLLELIKGVIQPNLIWKAGRTAEALRTITVSCFLSIIQTYKISDDVTIMHLLDDLVPLLLTLVEDASKKTRQYSCFVLRHIISAAQTLCKLNAEHIHRIYCVVLKRLDDVDDGVRRGAVQLLLKLFSDLPGDYNIECSSAHLEALFSTLLIHLDDPSEEFGSLILGVLKDLSGLKPEYLEEKLKMAQNNFRNQQACQDLISFIANKMQ